LVIRGAISAIPHAIAKFNLIAFLRIIGGHDHSDYRYQRICKFQYGHRLREVGGGAYFSFAVALPLRSPASRVAHEN